jgi:hypothetical protein
MYFCGGKESTQLGFIVEKKEAEPGRLENEYYPPV